MLKVYYSLLAPQVLILLFHFQSVSSISMAMLVEKSFTGALVQGEVGYNPR